MVDDFLRACELHDVEGLRAVLGRGLDPNAPMQGKMPSLWPIEMYTRSDAFPACLRVLLDASGGPRLGATIGNGEHDLLDVHNGIGYLIQTIVAMNGERPRPLCGPRCV